MSDEKSLNDGLGQWLVMSLDEGFHAYDKTSGLQWPPKRSTAGAKIRHVWRDGWNAAPGEKPESWLRRLLPKPRETEREYRQAHFVWELSTGQADAIGHPLPRKETDRPVLVPQEAWKKCHLCWETATLSGAGFEFANIRILMPERSVLLSNGLYFIEPIPPLDRFEPSEAERILKGIPVAPEAVTQLSTSKNPPGRPSNKPDILAAFEEIEKDPSWTQKELSNAIRKQLMEKHGLQSDDGLSHKTIMRHVDDVWKAFKGQKP